MLYKIYVVSFYTLCLIFSFLTDIPYLGPVIGLIVVLNFALMTYEVFGEYMARRKKNGKLYHGRELR